MRDRILRELNLALDQLDFGEDIDWREPLPDNFEELYLLRSMAMRVIQAAAKIRERVDRAIADQLGEGGSARVGDELIRFAAPNDYVLTEGGVAWLSTLETRDVIDVLPKARKFRKGGLVAVAERLGMPPDSLEGSLYVNRRDLREPGISVMPIGHERTPKYAGEMESGEIRRRR